MAATMAPHRHVALGGEPSTARSAASTPKIYALDKIYGIRFVCKGVDLNYQKFYPHISKKKPCLRFSLSEYEKAIYSPRWLEFKGQRISFQRARRMIHTTPLASPDDGMTVDGIPQASSSSDVEKLRIKLDQTLQSEDLSSGLVQSIHDAARAIELAFLDHSASSKRSWFPKTWLGVDKNAWIKSLSYQVAVDSLLQAAIEISSRGNGRDRDINVIVQRSLTRLHGPLESVIQDQLSKKEPTSYEWYLSDQNPVVVRTFVNLFEKDPRFGSATAICCEGEPGNPSESYLSLLLLALSCLAAITKLGSAKVSCQQFFTMVPDIIGRFMDMLLEFVPIGKTYQLMKDLGLHREFLFHFGPRAATAKFPNDPGVEISFWVDLVQKQLQRAIDREKIWSRLTTSESIEVLEKDLAIFGFFIAMGRSTQAYLSSSGFTDLDDPINGIVRYLIGGSVLYYPQLSSISSYQLYVEVVCEELEWLPFYSSDSSTVMPDSKDKEGMPKGEAISRVLDVCSYWMTSFIKYSTWVENPSNIKAARFLSRGHAMLSDCMKDLGATRNRKKDTAEDQSFLVPEGNLFAGSELDSFDEALESVEEALIRLENLLQELHLSSSNSGKEQLKAACSDLEMIRKLKKEAEFLEASFRAKAECLEQADADGQPVSSAGEEKMASRANGTSISPKLVERADKKPRDFWSFLVRSSTRKSEQGQPIADQNTTVAKVDNQDMESNDILRFEQLRRELIELEKRVQRSTDEEMDVTDDKAIDASATSLHVLVPTRASPKKANVITRAMEKIKETTTDVWQGTQLLAIDTAAATVLLKRALTGDELTQKEKKALQRTVTDLASVVPIGILMLLPVTAVGHAAILAFIQRYVPSLIPSTYAPERLDLLRQLEKLKEMDIVEERSDEGDGEVSLSSSKMK